MVKKILEKNFKFRKEKKIKINYKKKIIFF